MIFDKLCGLVERHVPELIPVLTKARLFVFDGAAKEFLPSEVSDAEKEFARDLLMLPFPIVALEDVSSCVILSDVLENQKGCMTPRFFLDCVPMDAPIESFREANDPRMPWFKDVRSGLPAGTCMLTFGDIRLLRIEKKTFLADGELVWQMFASKDKIFATPDEMKRIREEHEEVRRSSLVNGLTALEELMFLYAPSRWIIEELPSDPRPFNRLLKIPRSHQRSRFISLTRREARERLRLPEESGEKRRSPEAHARRAHPRTFKADRFVKMKGKTIMVQSSWVGPTDVKVGKKIYKVRVDLWEKTSKYFSEQGMGAVREYH